MYPKDESLPSKRTLGFGGSASSSATPVKAEIGFVGLGHMGTVMAANLAAAGHRVSAYVRRPDRMDTLAAIGLRPTMKITELFDREFVISMLPEDHAVRDVVLGQYDLGITGLAAGLKRGAIHLSMSTISTITASHLAREHARHGQGYVAAPGKTDAQRVLSLSPPGPRPSRTLSAAIRRFDREHSLPAQIPTRKPRQTSGIYPRPREISRSRRLSSAD